jgi:outer membrane protein assembly factor BamB
MARFLRHGRLLLSALVLLGVTGSVFAIIAAPLPLQAIVADSDWIVVAKVEKIDSDASLVALTVTEDLKGKATVRRLAVTFRGDEEAKKLNHVPQLLKRLAPELPLILTVNKNGKRYSAFVYTNGTWFQLRGQQGDAADKVFWNLTHGEPNLRGTFKGTTAELKQLIVDHLAGKTKLPGQNDKEPPGFGPEVPAKERTGLRTPATDLLFGRTLKASGGPLFGVIPTLGVGAPLLVLAALFPAVFGGVLLLFRQWIAFITVFSINSMLLLLQWLLNSYAPGVLRDSWLGTEAGLWFCMTLTALGGTIWAWQRQLVRIAQADLSAEAPPKTELLVLWTLAVVFVLASVATPLLSWQLAKHYDVRTDLATMSMAVLTLGVLAGAVYRAGRDYTRTQAPLATEGVMVAAILLGQLGYTAYRWSGDDLGTAGEQVAVTGSAAPAVAGVNAPAAPKVRWQFVPERFTGMILATPLVHGDEVWIAAARTSYKDGTLFCLNRADGVKKAEFLGADDDLKQMISSPVIVDGRLYMGEGFHNDPRCRLFCVDPKQRKELWAFPTSGQTEATPCISDARVYFAAGNDGIYCVDAVKGAQMWRYPPTDYEGRLLRCGCTPALAGDRLFAGSAVDRNQQDDKGETAIFCLGAASGHLRWKKAIDLPCWAGPVVSGAQVFFALGNGDVLDDADSEAPAGELICTDHDGKERWRFEVPNGILDKPAVDAQQVYFSCRDGHVYCLGRHTGKLRWKRPCGSPVVASPVLARCPGYAQTAHVFTVSTAGVVACLDPTTGEPYWELPLTTKKAHFTATPQVIVTRSDSGDRRQLYVAGAIGEIGVGRPIVFCIEDFVRVE